MVTGLLTDVTETGKKICRSSRAKRCQCRTKSVILEKTKAVINYIETRLRAVRGLVIETVNKAESQFAKQRLLSMKLFLKSGGIHELQNPLCSLPSSSFSKFPYALYLDTVKILIAFDHEMYALLDRDLCNYISGNNSIYCLDFPFQGHGTLYIPFCFIVFPNTSSMLRLLCINDVDDRGRFFMTRREKDE